MEDEGMKKRVVANVVCIVMLCGVLTGCCIKHDWQEATCTEPVTCAKCGETEGEALGHTWVEATCTEPKTCSVCGATEGEALGHDMVEANYQQAAVCKVCGETEGEPLQADFDKYGLSCDAELDTEYSFETTLFDDMSKTTTGRVTLSDYETFESDDSHPAIEGYMWHAVTITSDTDILGRNMSYPAMWGVYDYYRIDDDAIGYDSETGYLTYPINYNGEEIQTYEDFDTSDFEFIENGSETTQTGPGMWFKIGKFIQRNKTTIYVAAPEGYDGIVVSLKSLLPSDFDEDGNILSKAIYDYPQEQIIGFFRMK